MAQSVGRRIALIFHDHGSKRGSAARPGPTLSPGKDAVPIAQEAGWAPRPVGRAKNLASQGFDPQTVQPVVSRNTD